jgi:hypothetical protein
MATFMWKGIQAWGQHLLWIKTNMSENEGQRGPIPMTLTFHLGK